MLVIIVLMASCSKPETVEIYTVKAGKHTCTNRGVVIEKYHISFNFTIDDSWHWADGLSKSKIYGLSFQRPLKNSVRLAVQMIDGKPNLFMMVHTDGSDPIFKHIGVYEQGTYSCSLGYNHESQYFYLEMGGETYTIPGDKQDLGEAYLCYPYIGGDYTIGRDWTVKIEIDELE